MSIVEAPWYSSGRWSGRVFGADERIWSGRICSSPLQTTFGQESAPSTLPIRSQHLRMEIIIIIIIIFVELWDFRQLPKAVPRSS
jgi:hypothetical protein